MFRSGQNSALGYLPPGAGTAVFSLMRPIRSILLNRMRVGSILMPITAATAPLNSKSVV